ncbi:histidyl-tRNA synthetase [Denitrovibrio acetiphilus DSM 12809]|uniref:Histidine--tRNA ligase n=1 Tax=Denitrovibrio acetiphilus (strain DSM 12809 / NBRC 114555 / N2460) TaxID=522772 RepID=D4H857_DENA2|nr:histidine--tRNA ligase [Denitrovibrio acetiphilus]ADD68206.1 histidyl-tRNA synthetase [Denitrovibrio acetiphilus DSM 12809]
MYKKVKGFRDIYGLESRYWQKVEKIFKETFKSFNYQEFYLPVLEKIEVFDRGIGGSTDIVEKEMFAFEDRDGTNVALRPEGTASIVRAYVENKLYNPPATSKYYYIGPMFRRERPQKGRFRQFTQAGIEVFGSAGPAVDADVVNVLYTLACNLGIEEFVSMEINSIGCPECRPAYNEKLIAYLNDNKEGLCEDCLRRLNKNPMRILDCKNDGCKAITKNAPVALDHLCGECEEHFNGVRNYLDTLGVPYNVNPMMVRGLDYYVRTAFELVTNKLGSQSAVGAGGRYDGLIQLLGGPDTPGIGFATGIDRMVALAMLKETEKENEIDAFVVSFKDISDKKALKMVNDMRSAGISADMDYDFRKMKKQFSLADKNGARFTVILGEDEMNKGTAAVKDMETGGQEDVMLEKTIEYISDKLRRN